MQYYAPTEISDLYVTQISLKDDIVMDELNAKVIFVNTFLGHAMERHGLGGRYNNGERLTDLRSFHRLILAKYSMRPVEF